MELDPLLLSRIQFAFVVSFHAIFPVFTIGLASYIALLEGLLYKTGNPAYEQLSRFWTKVFAVVFGMGVVSGIVMSFQFGTNWSVFSYASANFLGPVLAYEVVTAFFLEAVFLGVLLFGRDKVPRGTHLFAACMVALGTFISSFWILSANSWMQTPAGVELRDGIFHLTSWGEAIFNPSFWPRFFHVALASFLTGGFVVAAVSAWYLLKGKTPLASKKALQMCLIMLALAAPAQLLVGDVHGLNTLEHQPAKVAAMEGVWETTDGAPLLLFAIPSQSQERNFMEVGIPKLASLILTHEWDGRVEGLKEWAPEDRPNVPIVFWSFRIMVGIGLLMIVMALWGAWLTWRGRLEHSPRFLRLLSFMIPLPFVAVLAGWFVTEVGRQPWLSYGLMRVEEGLTPSLTGGMALFSLIGFIAVYAVVFIAGVTFLVRIIRKGPDEAQGDHPVPGAHPKRPFSAADESITQPAR
ncbi:cytochrome D ubiquinol oxidase subunit I [Ectothiorhodospira haloalkaliphila]|uniref:Cytochrome D ubiquinol oxidase subunit I n=1 Tax=Ectothiorhodospira haloalkaliphila TaxID=421628 RepID=W8KPQ1_9GAMM|nr:MULTISPECIES: cytochrome ubiquinol oxidase subunit I [Ectothiorhodospira]AHK78992.1 cytochrome D ubiquinol oxidase subunit I [Ectothiorhodospira haloalkaliphila]MCG5493731.1 cytochrome ubiquinol oxidase subunit I [Ectothiorhodospira variabilis]MCG5497822.1 cytochrome ubiquinol oxidase subunit I [Ectothiorhodospira variabilis]MCG5503930.1 cytochrome ubiquinol oxidase subunit I [Ectothiorhodospira variabilis]MCG5507085.1 cytochrome ubiquinol oxidase subunit I [Ectothiorhodospira variabilis]